MYDGQHLLESLTITLINQDPPDGGRSEGYITSERAKVLMGIEGGHFIFHSSTNGSPFEASHREKSNANPLIPKALSVFLI